MTDDPREWIAVAALPGVGPASLKKLWEAGWTPSKLLRASSGELQQLRLSAKSKSALRAFQKESGPLFQAVHRVEHWLARSETHALISFSDENYPELLKALSDPPPLLFAKGNIAALSLPQLAIVGSRSASSSGLRHATAFADSLSRSGFVITSGLALGIDAAAHQAAVNNGLPTVAVLGSGLERVYPARNRILAERIINNDGVLLSEFFPATPPVAANFPRRNRIISGLSVGVLVVEAARQSGSLITARFALEQGREVFALPGALNNPMSRGCHQLIRNGAVLVDNDQQIIEELGSLLGSMAEQVPSGELLLSAELPELSNDERQLLQMLGFEPCHIDQLCAISGISVAALSQRLISLELKGYISSQGMVYSRDKG